MIYIFYLIIKNMVSLTSAWSTYNRKEKERFSWLNNKGLYICGEGMFCDDNEVYESEDQERRYNNDEIKTKIQDLGALYSEEVVNKLADVTAFRIKHKVDPTIHKVSTEQVVQDGEVAGVRIKPSELDVFRKQQDDDYTYDSSKPDTSYFQYMLEKAKMRVKEEEKDHRVTRIKDDMERLRNDLERQLQDLRSQTQ
jgi:hypothetical protein